MHHSKVSRAACVISMLAALISGRARADEPRIEELGKQIRVVRGAINGVLISREGKTLSIYGDPREKPPAADTVLLTHSRRDAAWAARSLVAGGARAIVPAAEAEQFTQAAQFWSDFAQKRFHDYAQQTSKLLGEPMAVSATAKDGDRLDWNGMPIRVLDTPGYTRGSVTYIMDIEGRRFAFTGDLLYDGGKLFDLYSLQDAIPAAKIGGYHGYAARLADVVASLRKVAAEKPDVIVPCRGPVITEPAKTIETLIGRIEKFYGNYLSIESLRWYFHDEHMLAKARRVLGKDATVDWMPMAETMQKLPAWIVPIDNARLMISADGTGFLVDCGSQHILDEVKKLQAAGKVKSIEHIFITHYHDDHTNEVAKAAAEFKAVVHASPRCRDILENPSAYRLPCLTMNPVKITSCDPSGTSWKWKEFKFTLFYFPGQTLLHDALLVDKEGGEQYFFIGDSFAPSGIDDYCLQNRDFVADGEGFLFCLGLVKRVAPNAMLINQHVEPAFRFSASQFERMERTIHERIELLRALLPWDDPNFGLDEGWARFYPYALKVRPGTSGRVELRIWNHSEKAQTFRVKPNLPAGFSLVSMTPQPISIPSKSEAAVEITLAAPSETPDGIRLLTADVAWGDWELREWTEAMLTVNRDP